MNATRTTFTSAPLIAGTSLQNVIDQPSSYTTLVLVHAILLAASLVLGFPLGVILLRLPWRFSFKAHWVLQITLSSACLLGLILAITLSATGVEYASFNEAHQIIGLAVVTSLLLQITFGYLHHQKYKKAGTRTTPSYLHVVLGRIVIYGGMINSALYGSLPTSRALFSSHPMN